MDINHVITANFEDGAVYRFECAADEDILTAALRQQVTLLCSCRKAFCGSCKARCLEGDYEFGERVNVQVLSPKEEEDGIVVACDTFPRSDLALAFPYTSDRLGLMANDLGARVLGVERLSSAVYKLMLQVFDADSGMPQRFEFEPGQYAEIGIPDCEVRRAFSLANLPNDAGTMEFLIRLIPGGRFSVYLEQRAAPGQILNLRGPLGAFTLAPGAEPRETAAGRVDSSPVLAFVGGSTGLAPLISMLRELARRDYPGECHLFFGMQDGASMYYERELRELASSMKRLTLHLALMDPPAGWQGFKGNAVAAFERYFADFGRTPEVYLCGPAAMVAAALTSCEQLGIAGSAIHREEFVASGP